MFFNRHSTMKLKSFLIILVICFLSKLNLITAQVSGGKVPGAPEMPPQRSVQISADEQNFNDSLINSRTNPKTAKDATIGTKLTPEELALEKKTTLRNKIFGTEIFSNKNLKFDANMNMATPVDYKIGPSDELTLDIYGYSQKTYKLKVDTEGYVNIEKIGLIPVNGLSIDEAKSRIRNRLSKVYVGISPSDGYATDTYISLSLGNIRTIRVTVLGEAVNPGTYSLSSLGTVMNALYLAGGPNEIGSYRAIELIRKDKLVASIDLYEFLIKGIKQNDVRLLDQDRILIKPYWKRVELEGQIKKPGIYEVTATEPLAKVIENAGGFNELAYTSRLRIIRNTEREKRILDAKKEDFSRFTLENGDVITINEILERFENQVIINGAVFRPGNFSLNDNPTLLTLLRSAEGVKEDAFLQNARIIRLKPDHNQSILSFNLGRLLNGDDPDITLQREDRIEISSIFNLKEEFNVGIRGEINFKIQGEVLTEKEELEKKEDEVTQGGPVFQKFPFYNDMTLLDLIVLGNGFKESAAGGSIDVVRRKRKSGAMDDLNITSDLSKTFTFKIGSNLLLNDKDAVFPLEPFDEVFVRASPNYEAQQFVTINGQVVKQGPYGILNKNERISDIIKRAGGTTEFAFIEGATLLRRVKLTDLELEAKNKQIEVLKDGKNQALKIEDAKKESNERIGIDMEKAIKNPGSFYDLILQDGDVITVPKYPQTVKVSGEVLYPNTTQFEDNGHFKTYISKAGGFTNQSLRKKSYILYANGSAGQTKRFLFFNMFPKVRPGSEIIIPERVRQTNIQSIAGTIGTITGGLSTIITSYLLIKSL